MSSINGDTRIFIRRSVFWPSYGAFFLIGFLSLFYGDYFIEKLTFIKEILFLHLDWLYAYGTLAMVFICLGIYMSPLAQVRIGGVNAKPLLKKSQWFAISLCTSVTAGIMFWATSEPLYHLMSPPVTLSIQPGSKEASYFAVATLFHHWSITPYAIYTLPAMAFALAVYNLKQPLSLVGIFSPILSNNTHRWSSLVDGVCVFALASGFAASLGTGALTIAGAFRNYLNKENETILLAIVTILLVLMFTLSALSGLMKGIRLLSNLNIFFFFLLLIMIFMLGPTNAIVNSIFQSIKYFVHNFFPMSTFITSKTGDPWPNQWPIFYWSSWLSWAPITAVFLGRISYGYRIKDFIVINLFAPSLFSLIWIGIFASSTIYYNELDGSLYKLLQDFGPNAISYELLARLPFAWPLTILFVVTTFISYTTAADSITDAISTLCTKQSTNIVTGQSSNKVKLAWSFATGSVVLILINLSGIQGMKLLCCVGGLPALFFVLFATVSLIKMGFYDLKVLGGSEIGNEIAWAFSKSKK